METLQRTANRGSISTGYDIDNSVKLEADNNEWFYRASPTEGNRRTFTFSFWIKRTGLGTVNASGVQYVAGQGQHGRMYFTSDYFGFRFDDGHDTRDITTLHRDPSAWLHVVVAVETNQVSSSNRVKIYFNGVQTTAIDFDGGSYPDIQDQSSGWFTTNYLTVGTAPFGGSYNVGDGDYDMRGYLAEFCAVDGQQLAPTDFGEVDSDSGIWKPKDVSGIDFGSEGYYLDFADASDLGDDESGNSNDFVENNIAAADQSTDTPTNNFCTWNPLWEYLYMPVFKEGATVAAYDNSTDENAKGNIGLTNGKWYWEAKPSGTIGSQFIGIATANTAYTIGGQGLTQNYNMTIEPQGRYYSYAGSLSESSAGQFTALTTSDTLGIALDMDSSTQTIKYYANGSLILTRNLITEMQGKTVFPFLQNYESRTFNINFGGYTINSISSAASDANGYGTFEHAPPSGYYAICTKNLAEYG